MIKDFSQFYMIGVKVGDKLVQCMKVESHVHRLKKLDRVKNLMQRIGFMCRWG